MTEEKENCNFQQNYNVFGLDDKPCCYLYHKYCDEIDSCYFKRCKRLEQQNKELKTCIEMIKNTEGQAHIEGVRLAKENKNYRSALEEIREIVKVDCKGCTAECDCDEDCTRYIIKNKINEVLSNDGN